MNVDSIKNGFVIDHITVGRGMKIYHFLGLDALGCPVAIVQNAPSRKMGKKDIIKVATELPIDLSALGYIDSDVTVNVIENGTLTRKYHPELPVQITDIIKCKNPRCITGTEQELSHIFRLTNRESKTYRCIYCESEAKR